jgi:hypothetical protein
MEIEKENKTLKNLFKNCVFFISREVPRDIFALAILSCGGIYGDDSENSPFERVNLKLLTYLKIGRSKNHPLCH